MSDLDLLGVLLGYKTAERAFEAAGGSLSRLLDESIPLDEVKPWVRRKLLIARELVRRSMGETLVAKDVLSSPKVVRDYLKITLMGRGYELFMVIFLDSQHRVITVEEMFRGTLNQTCVYPREVVKTSLRHNAAAVIFAHNHPSGVTEPSHADELLTASLKHALGLVDVRVIDHCIVAGSAILSFAERGLL